VAYNLGGGIFKLNHHKLKQGIGTN